MSQCYDCATQTLVTLVMAIIFALTSLVLFIRLHRIKAKVTKVVESEAVPPEIKEAVHEMANQVFKLRGGLRRIARAEDPLEALVNAISRHNGNDDGEPVK